MSRENTRSSIRTYPGTVAQLRAIAAELVLAYVDHHGPRWWSRDDGPTSDEVILHLIGFYRKWQARRRKAGQARNAKRKALRAAGLDAGGKK